MKELFEIIDSLPQEKVQWFCIAVLGFERIIDLITE
jgi:hypothetical protein